MLCFSPIVSVCREVKKKNVKDHKLERKFYVHKPLTKMFVPLLLPPRVKGIRRRTVPICKKKNILSKINKTVKRNILKY